MSDSEIKPVLPSALERIRWGLDSAMGIVQMDDVRELLAHIDRLTAERDAAVADANRYRWLRHGDNDEYVLREEVVTGQAYLLRNKRLDDVIDAARAQERQ